MKKPTFPQILKTKIKFSYYYTRQRPSGYTQRDLIEYFQVFIFSQHLISNFRLYSYFTAHVGTDNIQLSLR